MDRENSETPLEPNQKPAQSEGDQDAIKSSQSATNSGELEASAARDEQMPQTISTRDEIQPPGQEMAETQPHIQNLLGELIDALPDDQKDLDNTLPFTTLRPRCVQTIAQSHSLQSISVRPRTIRTADEVSQRQGVHESENLELDYITGTLLGQGGMGQVHRARQVALGRDVAVKQIRQRHSKDRTIRDDFLTEAVLTGKLEHPNIVPIYEVGSSSNGDLFYSMKNIKGCAWNETIDQQSLDQNLDVLLRVCDAIAFAHAEGVIHRDLKPQNIMTGGFGEVLVLDWGLAVLFGEGKDIEEVPAGTPAYMAPEMVNLKPPLGPASDIYLLGAILYRILNRHAPHAGRAAGQSLSAASKNEIQPPNETLVNKVDPSGELLSIAMRAMETIPSDRYSTVQEFQDSIRNFRSHRESLRMSARAAQSLTEATADKDYTAFSRAVFGFEEAIEVWGGNQQAREDVRAARLEWAECAAAQGDFELGLSLLEDAKCDRSIAENPSELAVDSEANASEELAHRSQNQIHEDLFQRLIAGRDERNERQARLRNLKRFLSIGTLSALVLVSVLGSLAAIQWYKTEDARQAESGQRIEAERHRKRAEQQHAEAVKQKDEANTQRLAADTQREAAVAARNDALQAQRDEHTQRQIAERNAYGAEMLLAQRDWREANIGRLRSMLNRYKDREEFQGFEWNYWNRLINFDVRTIPTELRVTSIAFSHDDTRIAAAFDDGNIRIWDIATGKLQQSFQSQVKVMQLAFHPQGELLATTAANGRIRLWNLKDGTIGRLLPGFNSSVMCFAFNQQGDRLATGDFSGTFRIWDFEKREVIKSVKGHTAAVTCLAFSPSGDRLMTGGADSKVKMWSLLVQGRMRVLTDHRHERRVLSVSFNSDGKQVASSGKTIYLTHLEKNTTRTFDGHVSYIYEIDFTPDGKRLVSSSQDGKIRIWNVRDGSSTILRGHASWILNSIVSNDGLRIASSSIDKTIKVWDINRTQEPRTLIGHESTIVDAGFDRNTQYMVTGSNDGTARVWDAVTGELKRVIKPSSRILAAAINGTGKMIVTGCLDRTAKIWNSQSGELLTILHGHEGSIQHVEFSPDDTQVLTTSSDQTAKLWDVDTGELKMTYSGHTDYVFAATFSADGKYVATASKDASSIIFETKTGKLIRRLTAHSRPVRSVKFNPTGTWVATSSGDGTIKQFDLSTGEEIMTLQGHSDGVMAIDYSPDGKRLVSASQDRKVKLWDSHTGQELLALDHHNDFVLTVAFSKDGKLIASGGQDNVVKIVTAE